MRRKSSKTGRLQVVPTTTVVESGLSRRMSESLMPLITGIVEAKRDLLSFMYGVGQHALKILLESEVEEMTGPKKKRIDERELYRWGQTGTEFPLGGRRVTISCPRVRRRGDASIGKGGREIQLPSVAHFQSEDAIPEKVLNQILLGVSTRGYDASLDAAPADLRKRGTSRAAASRQLIAITRKKTQEEFTRRLDDVRLAAIMIDGIAISQHTAILALGITMDGNKLPLSLEVGSTENAALCTVMLQGLLDRGLRFDRRVLIVIDGGKGLRRAIEDVFGDTAVIQRCQNHKRRNILRLLPERCHAYVNRSLSDAWASGSLKTAREIIKRLVTWLERDGHDTAAASLREGLEETLTIVKLGVTGSLRAFFCTTNAIENVMGSVRDVTANVKRWRKGDMIKRWIGLSFITAAKRFRRIKGYKTMSMLVAALEDKEQAASVDSKSKAA